LKYVSTGVVVWFVKIRKDGGNKRVKELESEKNRVGRDKKFPEFFPSQNRRIGGCKYYRREKQYR
jgi:hypothetical protein